MSKQREKHPDKKNAADDNFDFDDVKEKQFIISSIMSRVDALESEELKLLLHLTGRLKSTENDVT